MCFSTMDIFTTTYMFLEHVSYSLPYTQAYKQTKKSYVNSVVSL